MSSWYVFSALGFYPVNPAQGVYAFGSPIIDTARLNLENGKIFTVETKNNSSENKYIQTIELNGKIIERNYITHTEIMNGGKLIFTMGNLPNKNVKNTMASSSKVYH